MLLFKFFIKNKYFLNILFTVSNVVFFFNCCIFIVFFYFYFFQRGFPGGLVFVKNLPANAGDLSSISGLGRFLGERNGNPLQCSCLENPHRQSSLAGSSSGNPKELDTDWATKQIREIRDTFNFQSLPSLLLNISFPTHQAYAAFVYLLNAPKEEFESCPFTLWMSAELLCVSIARSFLVNRIFGPQIWMSIVPPFLLVTVSQCVCYFHQTGLFTLPWILPMFSPMLSHLSLFPPTLVMPAT